MCQYIVDYMAFLRDASADLLMLFVAYLKFIELRVIQNAILVEIAKVEDTLQSVDTRGLQDMFPRVVQWGCWVKNGLLRKVKYF